MSSHSGKNKSEFTLESLSDRLRSTLTYGEEDGGVNKPDFRELDLGSPVSPLRTRTASGGGLTAATTTTTTSSSSSSSGSVSGRASAGLNSNLPRKSDSNPKSNSGELSVESSPSAGRTLNPGHTRSHSTGGHPLIYSGSGSVTSPSVNVLPTGNICPAGRIVKTGMATRSSKTDVLGSGSGNYGHGSIMRGGLASKLAPDGSGGSASYSRGLMIGGEPVKRTAASGGGGDPEELKRMGNDNYRRGNFVEALSLYDKAIALSPGNAAYRFNRSAALMGMKRLVEAVKECEEVIRLDPGYVKAHHRLGSLFLSLGQVDNARKHICLPGHQPDSTELQKLQLVEKHLIRCTDARKVGDWRSALKEVDAAIPSGADASPQLFACRAETLLKLYQLDDAFLAMPNISKSTGPHSQSKIFGMLFEAYLFYVNAQIELAKGRFDSALAAIEKAAHVDPRNVDISILLNKVRLVCRARARGNDLFKSERLTEACSAYGEGLKLDPSNSVLYCNRAACWFKLGQWERSVDDCNQALRIQPNYIKALLRRAASNGKLEGWTEAVRDYEILRRELPDDKDVAESLFHAQIALKKSRGEEVHNMKFGGEVETVSGLDKFRAAISSPGASVVLFKCGSSVECKQISPFLDTLCTRYPSVNFLKVDVEESSAIAHAENVRLVPTFKIYRKGVRVKEMICPSPEVLESSVRHYSI